MLHVAGWCQRPACGAGYELLIPYTPGQIASTGVRYCSKTCFEAMKKSRKKGWKYAKRCWACWARPSHTGRLCQPCGYVGARTARAMCFGKQRLSGEAALDRAELWRSRGQPMNAYSCRVCGWAHVGHIPADAAEMKRRALTVDLWVASLTVQEHAELRARWEP
jgi:hypothetical protein